MEDKPLGSGKQETSPLSENNSTAKLTSKKQLASTLEMGAYQKKWFQHLRERIAAGEPYIIANADTPHFQARDIDFRTVLRNEIGGAPLRKSDSRHFGSAMSASGQAMYRIPTQPSADGNTVDTQEEKSAFMANAISYQSQIGFVNSITRKLLSAIKGQ